MGMADLKLNSEIHHLKARIAELERALAERAGGVNEDALRALAQAYDREDAAQRGEPDPWNLDDPGDIGDSDTWVSERIACARAAAEALLSALSRTGAVKVELSGNTGELIDKMAEAIRGDTTSNDTPWATLSEDRKIGWRGDAERALAVVKEYLTARRPSEQAVTEAMVEAAAKSLRPDLFAPLDADDLQSDDFAWTRREDAKANALHSARAALTAALATPLTEGGERNAVIEECALVAMRYGGECNMLQNDNVDREANTIRRDAAYAIEAAIRALKSGGPDA